MLTIYTGTSFGCHKLLGLVTGAHLWKQYVRMMWQNATSGRGDIKNIYQPLCHSANLVDRIPALPGGGHWSQAWMRPSFIMELEGGTGNKGQHLADHPLLRTPFDGDHVTMEGIAHPSHRHD